MIEQDEEIKLQHGISRDLLLYYLSYIQCICTLYHLKYNRIDYISAPLRFEHYAFIDYGDHDYGGWWHKRKRESGIYHEYGYLTMVLFGFYIYVSKRPFCIQVVW